MIGRLGRAGATVAIAGALVFAVPVTAQAGLLDPLTLGPYMIGAVRAAAPVEVAAGFLGPEATIAVTAGAMAGALAYATYDTWSPWVAGLFGQGGPQATTGSGLCYAVTPIGPGADPGTMSIQFTAGSACGSTVLVYPGPSSAQCLNLVTGSVVGMVPTFGAFQIRSYDDTTKATVTCPAGTSLRSWSIGIKASLNGAVHSTLSWGSSFDPQTEGTYTVSSDCVKPDGSLGTVSATTANPGLGGLLVPSCVKAFGPGSHATKFTLNGGQTGTTPHQLSTTNVPTDAQTAVLYPNCVGAGAIACTYIVDYQGVACVVGQAECVNWTLRQLAHPSDYSCFYGPYPLATTDSCAIDERVYEPNGVRLTMKNTDGDPWTYDSPAPAGMPEVQPAPGTGTGTVPGTGTGTVPGGSTGTTPSPAGVPATNGDCWSGGAFSWNPVDWVLTPIKCGLSWAFVPKTATLSTLAATAKTNLTTQGIGPMVTAVNANMSKVGGNGAGCAGPSVTFAAVGITKAMTPFNACTAPMSTLASISYAMTTIVVVLGGGFAAVKAVGAGFGFNFSMRRAGSGESA